VSVRVVHVALSRARANKTCRVCGMASNFYHIRAKRANVLFCMERPLEEHCLLGIVRLSHLQPSYKQ
jgi:hypothetical protein